MMLEQEATAISQRIVDELKQEGLELSLERARANVAEYIMNRLAKWENAITVAKEAMVG